MIKFSIQTLALLSVMASEMLVSVACSDGDDGVSSQNVSSETPVATDSSATLDSIHLDTVKGVKTLALDTISSYYVGPLPSDTVHYLYTSFVVKNEDGYDTIVAPEENIKCEVSESDLQCDLTVRNGECSEYIKYQFDVAVNDTVRLNYGDNPQTNFIPNRYAVNLPVFDVEVARNATDSLKALCGSVSQEFEAEDAEAENLPNYVSLSSETRNLCWSSSQYVERIATDSSNLNQTMSSCSVMENEGTPDTSITEFTTCSFEWVVELVTVDPCTTTVEHYPEERSMKKFHLTFASAAPMDTTIEWILKIQNYDGSSDSYNMTTRLFSN